MSEELIHVSGWLVLGGIVGYASTKWARAKAKFQEKVGIPKLHWEKKSAPKTQLEVIGQALGEKKSIPPPLPAKELSAAQARLEHIKQATPKRIRFDSQKRKSLQPSKTRPVPKMGDWSEKVSAESIRMPEPKPVKHTPPPKEHFTHRFFGTSLSVGGKVLYGGLSSGMHTLEITKEGLFIIDNKVLQVNQGDLERMKEMIRESRA